ncbi:MAG: hypothetical protein WAO76_04200, partial [Georgfuchsia sp.]
MPRALFALASFSLLLSFLLGLVASPLAWAQTSPARGALNAAQSAQSFQRSDDMPLADYLGFLRQIAPAAEDGARDYLAAFERRCGRALTTAELRRAMSQGDGDPVLMGLIRASQLRDTAAR